MENPSPQEHDEAHVIEIRKDRGHNFQQFKGIRLRKWGSWVSEIRMPKSREKLWLGSYPTAKQAARAYDAAVYCLRGPNAKFNFPNSVPDIPSASSLSRQEIKASAAKYAMHQLPSNNMAMEETASTSMSTAASEKEVSSGSHEVLEEHKFDFWESLFEESDGIDGGVGLNLERMPSIDVVWALDPNPGTWQQMDNIIDTTDLWSPQMDNIIGTTDLWHF